MNRRVHIVGIGGAGMSAIARVLHQRGDDVSGSDRERSKFAEQLRGEGIRVTFGHSAENVVGADVVLASAAIPEGNVELAAARQAAIPVRRRNQFWDELRRDQQFIAVAGTHGKTTTTGLVAGILENSGLSPSFIVGGELIDFDTNARAGQGDYFVVEADEYQMAFLGMQPTSALITNVEHDHPDQFETKGQMHDAFQKFVDQVQERLFVCADDEGAMALVAPGREMVTYGLHEAAQWRAEELRPNGAGGSDFLALKNQEVLGLVRTRLAGEHNVLNALGALAVVDSIGVSFVEAREALAEFHGTARRFQVLGEIAGVTVIDDYAHHPTEIQATLAAAKQRFPDQTVVAVFQPHTYSRTGRFLGQLANAFDEADKVIVTDIFAARETDDLGLSGALVAETIDHQDVKHMSNFKTIANHLLATIDEDTVVITLSAGDGNQVGTFLLEGLTEKRGSEYG